MLRSDATGIVVALVKSWFDKVSLVVNCGGVISMDTYFDRDFLHLDSLWMIVTVRGVGENRIVHN